MTRMWGTDPRRLSQKRLGGEHKETHQAEGCIKRGKYKQLLGHVRKGQVAVHLLKVRHDELAAEMLRREYKHNSPFSFHDLPKMGFINLEKSVRDLKKRGEDLKIKKVVKKRNKNEKRRIN